MEGDGLYSEQNSMRRVPVGKVLLEEAAHLSVDAENF